MPIAENQIVGENPVLGGKRVQTVTSNLRKKHILASSDVARIL